jgi:hypothetical protein
MAREDVALCQILLGAKIPSRRQNVLVNDTAETIAPQKGASGRRRRRSRPPCLRRRREGQRAMWPVPVVVIDEAL